MEKCEQPIVYVARKLYFYDDLGHTQEIAYFVSKAYLRKSTKQYNEDGSIDKEFYIDFNINPTIYAIDRNTFFHALNGDNIRVLEIFGDFDACRKYVDRINKRLSDHFSNVPSLTFNGESVIQRTAVEYGESLEKEFISPEERKTSIDQSSDDQEDILEQ